MVFVINIHVFKTSVLLELSDQFLSKMYDALYFLFFAFHKVTLIFFKIIFFYHFPIAFPITSPLNIKNIISFNNYKAKRFEYTCFFNCKLIQNIFMSNIAQTNFHLVHAPNFNFHSESLTSHHFD